MRRRHLLSDDVPELPLLAPWYRVAGDGDRILLEHGHRLLALDGAAARTLVPRLLPLLDGTRTCADLAAVLGAAAAPAIENALSLLAREGLLVAGPLPECGDEFRETVQLLAADAGEAPATVAGRLADARVGVVGDGAVGAEAARVLRRAGVVRVERRSWHDARCDDELAVVAPAAGEAHALAEWNEAALREQAVWLQVLPYDGRFTGIGPLFIPGETACHACYRLRRAAALGAGDAGDTVERQPLRAGGGPALEVAAGALTAMQVLRWLGIRDPYVPGLLLALELRGGPTVTRHRVLRVPRCPACSPLRATAAPLPWHRPPLDEDRASVAA